MRKIIYRIDISKDLHDRITREANRLRPPATVRAIAETLLWDALSAADFQRTRAEADNGRSRDLPAQKPAHGRPQVMPRRGDLNAEESRPLPPHPIDDAPDFEPPDFEPEEPDEP